MQAQTVQPPMGKEHSFIADFSNTGPEIDVAGPGVLGRVAAIGLLDGGDLLCAGAGRLGGGRGLR